MGDLSSKENPRVPVVISKIFLWILYQQLTVKKGHNTDVTLFREGITVNVNSGDLTTRGEPEVTTGQWFQWVVLQLSSCWNISQGHHHCSPRLWYWFIDDHLSIQISTEHPDRDSKDDNGRFVSRADKNQNIFSDCHQFCKRRIQMNGKCAVHVPWKGRRQQKSAVLIHTAYAFKINFAMISNASRKLFMSRYFICTCL